MTFGRSPTKKKVSVFVYAERCAPHVGTMYGFRTGCKLCQVNTTWEQTAAGRHLKRNSVLCLGLKSSDDLLKVTLLFVMTSLSDQCRGETSNQWTLIPKNLDWKWGGNIYNFWFFLDDWSLSFFLFMTFLWAFFFQLTVCDSMRPFLIWHFEAKYARKHLKKRSNITI